MSSEAETNQETASILVIGFGNPLLADDSLGVMAVRELERRYQLPERVQVMDGGTSSIGLYEILASKDLVLIVDAVVSDQPPGTLIRLYGEEIPAAVGKPLSAHQIGISDTLALLRAAGDAPDRICLLGMVPGSPEATDHNRGGIDARLDALVQLIVRELADVGVTLHA